MVKGVNKRVIEVNNTGSKFFEKIVFFITPEYSDLTAEQLHKAAKYVSLGLSEQPALRPPRLRKRRLRKKRVFCAIGIAVLVVAGIALRLIL